MNLQRRINITWLIVRARRIRFELYLIPSTRLLVGGANIAVTAIAKRRRRVGDELKRDFEDLKGRAELFNAECQSFLRNGGLTEERKRVLVAAGAALTADGKQLLVRNAKLKSPPSVLEGLSFMAASMQMWITKRQRDHAAFSKITSQIETSPTYYWDLLLWLAMPGGYVEEQIGDLNEEYRLRSSTEGELAAKSWYKCQVIESIKARCWDSLGRVVMIGTLVDFAYRWLRRR